MSLVIAPQVAMAVHVHTNAFVTTPSPACATMHTVVESIFSPQLPLVANVDPPTTIPPLVGAHSILVSTDSPVPTSPKPATSLVVMILSPQVPVSAYLAPVAIVVALQGAQAIAMHSNAPEAAPDPTQAVVTFVAIMVTTNQFPVRANPDPACTSPSFVDAETVQVKVDPAVFAPEPFVWPVVMVLLPEMPVRPHLTPVTLYIFVQSAQAITMMSNTPEAAPSPASASMQAVVVSIFSPQLPVSTHLDPIFTSPFLVHTVAVLVAAITLVAVSPEPPRTLVDIVGIALPQVPVRAYALPSALTVFEQGSKPVAVHTNSAEATPTPLRAAMFRCVPAVALPQVPVSTDLIPTRTIPTLQNAAAVQVTANALEATPEPAVWLVEMVMLPLDPLTTDSTPSALVIAV